MVLMVLWQFGLKQSSVYRDKHFFYHNEVEQYVQHALATRQVGRAAQRHASAHRRTTLL